MGGISKGILFSYPVLLINSNGSSSRRALLPPSVDRRFSPSSLTSSHQGTKPMALKAVHVSGVPCLNHVPETPPASHCISSSSFPGGVEVGRATAAIKAPKFVVIGHRGHGMNQVQSPDRRMKSFMENTILSFNSAAKHPLDFIEFDVQVTKDDCPVIFHDDVIISENNGSVFEKRVTELSLPEFLSYGLQREPGKVGMPLLRKTKDGKIRKWEVERDDVLCTLQEAFQKVEPSLGFNIELKFDDHIAYQQDYLVHVLQAILEVVFAYANQRPVIFSSFHPDAALLVRKLQTIYPVFFLTNGGTELYYDVRRNSLEEATKVCIEGGLQGIVSEVRGVFQNPGAVSKIKESKLSLLTYGKLNNVPEAVYMQHLMGISGVIVDLVQEITEAVSELIKPTTPPKEDEGDSCSIVGDIDGSRPKFSEKELAFILKLIPQLIQL